MKNQRQVTIYEEQYYNIANRAMLLNDVVNRINRGDKPDDIVAYIKLQYAAWVFDTLQPNALSTSDKA